MPKFKEGDSVVWSHIHGALHGEGSVLKKSAVEATARPGEGPVFGVVKGAANAEETWFDVSLEDGETRTLTGDELVLVSPEE